MTQIKEYLSGGGIYVTGGIPDHLFEASTTPLPYVAKGEVIILPVTTPRYIREDAPTHPTAPQVETQVTE